MNISTENTPLGKLGVTAMQNIEVSLTTLQGFELSQRAAKLLASSSLVPKDYQGNISNCVIALNMAQRIGADPLMVMQNLVIVHNRPTWSAQFLIATFNGCGKFTAIRYEFFGNKNTDEYGCRAYATEKATGEKLVGSDVTIGIAKAEQWYGRNGSKWKTMPQQMLQYRAASWFIRAIAPELSMGLHTTEEIRDVYDAEQNKSGTWEVSDTSIPDATAERVITETGEIVQLPECDPETFAKKSSNWKLQVESGKPVNEIIAIIETKFLLTDDQKMEIAGWAGAGGAQA